MIKHTEIILPEYSRGFHLITPIVSKAIDKLPNSGLLHLFITHTSAGITINENYDTSVRDDLKSFFSKLTDEKQRLYTHTIEGADDMPAHILSSIIGHSITIPIVDGKLALGTWQGIYLCEFRISGGRRKIIATIYN